MKPTWLESPTTNVERARRLPMLHKGVKTLCFFQTTYLNPTTQGDNRLNWAISNPENDSPTQRFLTKQQINLLI